MRLNAPIPALLALAVLYLLPVNSLAKSTHHRAPKAGAAHASMHQVRRRSSAEPIAHTASRQKSRQSAQPMGHFVRDAHPSRHHSTATPIVARVRESRRAQRHLRLVRATSRVADRERTGPDQTAAEAAPQKATTADFLKAASAPLQVQPAVAIHGTSQPDELNEAPSPAATQKQTSAPVGVVSVIRPTAERPQLNSVEAAASTPVIPPALYNKRGRLIVPPPLKGSHEILIHQNQVADRDGLSRIQNDDDLLEMRNQKLLVGLPVSAALEADHRLPSPHRAGHRHREARPLAY